MNFLNPLVLIGLAAASIPVLLHLLNLRKLKTIEFSSLKFLKELQKTKIRKFKIKQILLLIIRTLIIIFIVMAFARPTIPTSLPFFETYSKTSAVILIDNSFSMEVSDENGSRLKQAKQAAMSILESLKESDEVAVIEMGIKSSPNSQSFSKNFEFLKSQINKLQISYLTANINQSLKSAAFLSENATYLNKSLFVISDGQSNIFEVLNKDTSQIKNKFSNINFSKIGGNSQAGIKNLTLDSVNIITSIFSHNKVIEMDALIKNYSNSEIKGATLSLNYDSVRTAQRAFDIQIDNNRIVSIAAPVQKFGPTSVKIELENDAIDKDNNRYFGFNIPPKPKIIISGNNVTIKFIQTALKAVSSTDEFAQVDIFENQRISSLPLESYDVAIISGENGKTDYERLEKYINNGGSALLFPGNDFESINSGLKSLGLGGAGIKEFTKSEPMKFSFVDKVHPLFEGVFKQDESDKRMIESPAIYKIMNANSGLNLIGTSSGSFLAESRIGNGKLIYCGVSPDFSWSNLPITGIFPTLIYRSVVYLNASEDISDFALCGDILSVTLPLKYSSVKSFKIIDPNGKESFSPPSVLPGSITLTLDNLMIPGVYIIYDDNGKFVKQIAVNFDRTESDIKGLENKQIEEYFRKITGENTNININTDLDDLKVNIKRAVTGTELWQLFIILALLAAVTEMIIQRTLKKEVSEV